MQIDKGSPLKINSSKKFLYIQKTAMRKIYGVCPSVRVVLSHVKSLERVWWYMVYMIAHTRGIVRLNMCVNF